MSKIYYNLLIARILLNIYIYNILLIRFYILEKKDLVKAILSSIRELYIRLNEITYTIVLRHFTAIENRVKFIEYWRRIEGRRRELALMNPEQEIHPIL